MTLSLSKEIIQYFCPKQEGFAGWQQMAESDRLQVWKEFNLLFLTPQQRDVEEKNAGSH
jgi:hypothetical protein